MNFLELKVGIKLFLTTIPAREKKIVTRLIITYGIGTEFGFGLYIYVKYGLSKMKRYNRPIILRYR